jgi:hypothetical protein
MPFMVAERGTADDSAEEAETLRAGGTAAASADGSEPGVGVGFPAGCGGVRAGDPGAECGGCVHAGVFGLGGGYELFQPESDASAGCDRGRAGATEGDPVRQRAGVEESPFSGVVRGAADRAGEHSAGKADAERTGGELSRTAAGRVFNSKLVSEHAPYSDLRRFHQEKTQ